MTVNATTETRKQYTGNSGYTTSTDFTASFNYLSTSEIQVVHTNTTTATDTPYVEGTHYTVTSGTSAASVTIRFLTSYVPTAATEYVTIQRNMALSQDTDYTEGSALDAETLEQNFDKAIMIAQQIKNNVTDLNLSFSETNDFNTTAAAASDISVSKANRASKALKFNSDGDIGVSTYDPDAQVASATAQAEAAAASATTASGHASTAAGHVTTASEWASKTTGQVDSTDFSSKEYAVGTTASTGGSAKDWAVYTSGDVRGGSAGDMSAKEWAVGTQGRGVVNEGSAKDWATYTSGTVDDSEYSAKYYATQAQTSAAAAATSFDSFDDRYLGTMADSASGGGNGVSGTYNATKDGPGDDNDGNALVTGALYYNTTDGEMRVYSGSTWIAASAASNATVLDYTYTLSGSDSTISGSDDNSATLSFSSQESVDVFLNGVKLVPKIGSDANDYHLDTSNTVTLTSTAVSGDVILVRVYKTFTVGDAVPASTGGTFSGNVTVPNLIIGDGGTIGSASDTDAISISSGGNVTLSQTLDGGAIGSAVTMSANQACVKTALNASGSAPIYACRAWVNFNGTGTVAIRDSGNVSSITDNGTGNYTVNFTSAMPDTDYVGLMYNNAYTGTAAGSFNNHYIGGMGNKATTSITVVSHNNTTPVDSEMFDVVIIG